MEGTAADDPEAYGPVVDGPATADEKPLSRRWDATGTVTEERRATPTTEDVEPCSVVGRRKGSVLGRFTGGRCDPALLSGEDPDIAASSRLRFKASSSAAKSAE